MDFRAMLLFVVRHVSMWRLCISPVSFLYLVSCYHNSYSVVVKLGLKWYKTDHYMGFMETRGPRVPRSNKRLQCST